MLHYYFVACAAVFGFLFISWNKSDWSNMLLKFVFFGMFVWTAFITLQSLGFVIKVGV